MKNGGQSLLEVIIAVAVGTITILAAITVLSLILRIGRQDVSFQTGVFLEQEILDNVTVTAERDWQQLANTSEGQDYRLATTSTEGVFEVQGGNDVVIIGETAYTSFFRVSSVGRDGNWNIVTGGTNDPSTKKVDVFVTWLFQSSTVTSTIAKYITRTQNLVFSQSDWSGGASSTDPVFTRPKNIFFEASSTIDFSSQPGTIKIQGL